MKNSIKKLLSLFIALSSATMLKIKTANRVNNTEHLRIGENQLEGLNQLQQIVLEVQQAQQLELEAEQAQQRELLEAELVELLAAEQARETAAATKIQSIVRGTAVRRKEREVKFHTFMHYLIDEYRNIDIDFRAIERACQAFDLIQKIMEVQQKLITTLKEKPNKAIEKMAKDFMVHMIDKRFNTLKRFIEIAEKDLSSPENDNHKYLNLITKMKADVSSLDEESRMRIFSSPELSEYTTDLCGALD